MGGTVFAWGVGLALAATTSGAHRRDCGADPGPPRPVSTATCEAKVVIADVQRLLAVYLHRSCVLSQKPAAERRAAAELDRVTRLLSDPQVHAHLATCAGVDPATLEKKR